MGRAEDLFQRLIEGGERVLDDFIADRQSEELFLDFKTSADGGRGPRLSTADRANLAKAISGFGNSEGGVIVWGVECRTSSTAGDVAVGKVPIFNPRRFVAWLEGAVSGCTVPPHPHVRHHVISTSADDNGFVATHIPKSAFSPHQAVQRQQYYIRAGSDFVPAPHAVLAALFGHLPRPFLYHTWTGGPGTAVGDRVKADLGFRIHSDGPGIARDLYVNVHMFPPKGGTEVALQPDRQNWTGHFAFGVIANLVAVDSLKLAPGAFVQPVVLMFAFRPPFDSPLKYEIFFGHGSGPSLSLAVIVEPETLQTGWVDFTANPRAANADHRFTQVMLGLNREDVGQSREAYEASMRQRLF